MYRINKYKSLMGEAWSKEEDRILMMAHAELGGHWVGISEVTSISPEQFDTVS